MDAIERVKPLFEGAATLADLEAGAELAESWNIAAGNVRNAVDAPQRPATCSASWACWARTCSRRWMPPWRRPWPAMSAEALNKAAAVIDTINSGSSVGGLRLAGIVFFGVALVGIIGLWSSSGARPVRPGHASASRTG